jgi:hypothetical protein
LSRNVPISLVEQIGDIWNTLQAAGVRGGPPETKPPAVSHCPTETRHRKSNPRPAIRMRFLIHDLSVFGNGVLGETFGTKRENGIRIEKKIQNE